MKICAVVCEFNPFHNGHKYLLEKAKQLSECNAVLCVMSGNFVQRGEPAILEKSIRTKIALDNGADIVVELPIQYSTANAECFAYGAINIIKQIENVTHIAFGCENADTEIIKKLSKIRLDETNFFKENLKKSLESGLSYPTAHHQATLAEAEKCGIDTTMSDIILKKPNNLLAIEYCKQLLKQNCNIETIGIKRIGADHDADSINGAYTSSSSIRKKIYENTPAYVETTVPRDCFNALLAATDNRHIPDLQLFNKLIVYSLRINRLDNLFDAGEGIETKLKKAALNSNSLEEILQLVKSKRYTRARLNRLCLQSLLQINKNSLFTAPNVPVRLLGIKKELKKEIGNIYDRFIIKNRDFKKTSETDPQYFRIEENAAAVYAQLTRSDNTLYSSKLTEI